MGTLCGFFPNNGVENTVELAVGLEKRVEVGVRVFTVVAPRSIVSVSWFFSDSEDELDVERGRVTGMHGDKISMGKRRVTVRTVRKSEAVA
jgi:hypothetical protein